MRRRSFLHVLGASAISGLAFAEPEAEPWPLGAVLQPEQLASSIEHGSVGAAILYVGFGVLYRSAHIKGAQFAGPGSKSDGLELLANSVRDWKRERPIVLYCGCCPFAQCPNIRPAYSAVRDLRFHSVKVVHIPTNLHTDWIAKGYPTEKKAGA